MVYFGDQAGRRGDEPNIECGLLCEGLNDIIPLLGINSNNETRWRLLMELQQQQSRELEILRKQIAAIREENRQDGLPTMESVVD